LKLGLLVLLAVLSWRLAWIHLGFGLRLVQACLCIFFQWVLPSADFLLGCFRLVQACLCIFFHWVSPAADFLLGCLWLVQACLCIFFQWVSPSADFLLGCFRLVQACLCIFFHWVSPAADFLLGFTLDSVLVVPPLRPEIMSDVALCLSSLRLCLIAAGSWLFEWAIAGEFNIQ
jgi:hypothetical protein